MIYGASVGYSATREREPRTSDLHVVGRLYEMGPRDGTIRYEACAIARLCPRVRDRSHKWRARNNLQAPRNLNLLKTHSVSASDSSV